VTEGDTKEDKDLSEKQIKAVPHLISSKTLKEGCRKARISRKTLYQWLKDPVFKEELRRQRDVIIEEALENLKGAMTKATETLIDLLDKTDNEHLKRYVAKDIIEYVLKAKELGDLEERLVKIERIVFEKITYADRGRI
jgi:phage terminase small subunit